MLANLPTPEEVPTDPTHRLTEQKHVQQGLPQHEDGQYDLFEQEDDQDVQDMDSAISSQQNTIERREVRQSIFYSFSLSIRR